MEDPLTVPNSLTKEQASSFFDGRFFAYYCILLMLTVTKDSLVSPSATYFPASSVSLGRLQCFQMLSVPQSSSPNNPGAWPGMGKGEGASYHHLHLLSRQPLPRPI